MIRPEKETVKRSAQLKANETGKTQYLFFVSDVPDIHSIGNSPNYAGWYYITKPEDENYNFDSLERIEPE